MAVRLDEEETTEFLGFPTRYSQSGRDFRSSALLNSGMVVLPIFFRASEEAFDARLQYTVVLLITVYFW